MQQKQTNKPQLISLDDLPQLTPKQEKFARGLLDGLSASDAYRAAYNCQNSDDSTIWANASRLKTDNKISAWVHAARMAGLERGILTHEQFINRLLELSAKSEETGNMGAAVNALVQAGKAAGHLVERIEDITPVERKEIRERLKDMASKADLTVISDDQDQPVVRH